MEQVKIKGPDFFIVGAPKCGTTSLNNYLSQHPDIFMAEKEAHYFGADLGIKQKTLTLQEYLLLFNEGQDKKLRGEASVWYLYSKKAAEEIKAYKPDAKIIIMIRNPAEVIYSLHGQHLYEGDEYITDFEEAVRADESLAHRSNSAWTNFKTRPGYFETVQYKEQIERYWQIFGKEKVHIILFDDFASNTRREYQKTLKFLKVDESFVPVIKKINANKTYVNYSLHRFFKNTPVVAKTIFRSVIPVKKLRVKLSDYVYYKNIKSDERPSADHRSIEKILKKFRPEIIDLQDFLQVSLKNWLK